ncbi:MAG: T9SS type A sorting domain-containing protein [Bacteroidales bacterium]
MFFLEQYDKGYLSTGWFGPAYYPSSWLAKTDVNGNQLWYKTLTVNGFTGFAINEITESSDGSIYLAGGIGDGATLDGFVMKLNTCGEREWITKFYTPGHYDWTWHVTADADGGCTGLILNGDDYSGMADRLKLVHFSSNGQIEWTNYLLNDDSLARISDIRSMIKIQNSAYLLSGFIYYSSHINPNYYYYHPYIIKVDSAGSLVWQKIINKTSDDGGLIMSAYMDTTAPAYYLFGNNNTIINWPGYYIMNPCLYKLDFNGDTIYTKRIITDTASSAHYTVCADSMRFITSFDMDVGGPWWYQFLMKTDSLGNLMKYKKVIDDLYPMKVLKTFDGKILVLAVTSTVTTPVDFDTYLFKFNQDLEFDTLYTQNFNYDYLCPNPISNDTVWCNNPVIIGMDELVPDLRNNLTIYPNPANDMVAVKLPSYLVTKQNGPVFHSTFIQFNQTYKKGVLQIFDSFGRKVMEFPTAQGIPEIQLNINQLNNGLFVLRYSVGNQLRGCAKLIIQR